MKSILPLVLALWVLCPLSALTFDLKTPLAEKAALAPLKWGTTYWLMKAGLSVLDVGEDYAVWLKSRKETLSGDQITVDVLVQISETTGFSAKPVLAETRVSYRFPRNPPATMSSDKPFTLFIRTRLQYQGEAAWEEGRVGGAAVARAIEELVRRVRG